MGKGDFLNAKKKKTIYQIHLLLHFLHENVLDPKPFLCL